ncbi:unnamed protein product [Cuscuta campestris]|nr:unnamed protein product [Cuscuta campestris]
MELKALRAVMRPRRKSNPLPCDYITNIVIIIRATGIGPLGAKTALQVTAEEQISRDPQNTHLFPFSLREKIEGPVENREILRVVALPAATFISELIAVCEVEDDIRLLVELSRAVEGHESLEERGLGQ